MKSAYLILNQTRFLARQICKEGVVILFFFIVQRHRNSVTKTYMLPQLNLTTDSARNSIKR
jgi:hypothetical protein